MFIRTVASLATTVLLTLLTARASLAAPDPLPSWNTSASKQAIVAFVDSVADTASKHYVPPPERIATFDNDGTLWAEQPLYFQAIFAFDQVKKLAPQHPEWKQQQPFAAVLEGNTKAALSGGTADLMKVVMATHSGMTRQDFEDSAEAWLEEARHPTTGRRYTEMVYQPMLELLAYLRANGFKTYIVSGGGIEFMRPWTEEIYGIPPEQVVGTSIRTRYEVRDSGPVLVREPDLFFFDDKEGKPVAINHHIGRKPIMAVGNSDGDFQMLEWSTSGQGKRLGVLVHHTDAEREWAYDRKSHIGQLNRGLDEAGPRGWTVVDMKNDWKVIFPAR